MAVHTLPDNLRWLPILEQKLREGRRTPVEVSRASALVAVQLARLSCLMLVALDEGDHKQAQAYLNAYREVADGKTRVQLIA